MTELCNFKCTFCSSTNISDDHAEILDLEYVFDFLKRFPDTNTIIINGGDPLMVNPQYYWDIIDYLILNDMKATLSFTTNLWDFYKRPHKWVELFKNERVGVTTSFNYGDTRRITKTRVFTEEIFIQVSDKFLELIGYRPDFISVITDENEITALDNVYLAKKLNVECKLNYAMASGDQKTPYPLYKMYTTYFRVITRNLQRWEYNTKQLIQTLNHQSTTCPQSITCDSGIRAFNPDGSYYSCGSFADDKLYPINLDNEMSGKFITPLVDKIELASLTPDCFTCPMYKICNGCKKTIHDLKSANLQDEHCYNMKQLIPHLDNVKNG